MKQLCLILFTISVVLSGTFIAVAQHTARPPGVGFKRVVPPAPGTTPDIDVQVRPQEKEAVVEAAPPQPVAIDPEIEERLASWFWDRVTPALEPPEDGRLLVALEALEAAPEGSLPPIRLDTFASIIRAHGKDILLASVEADLSPAFILAVIAVESSGNAKAESHAGAQGLMQLMPATAKRFDVTDSFDPKQNIKAGTTYLAWLMDQFYGDPLMALAGYNAGENSVRANGGVPPYSETRNYVPKVLSAWTTARRLCTRPPELLSDGCVFQLKE